MLEQEVRLAEIELERNSYGVEELQKIIEDSQIVAPFDGVVLTLQVAPGREVGAFQPLVTVADLANLEIGADLISDQMQPLQEGMAATAFLVGQPGEGLSGEIRLLPMPFGTGEAEDENNGGFPVRISLDDLPPELESGDLVRITVILEQKGDVLWLPKQAIRSFEGRRFVLVEEGEGQRRVDVELGIEGDDRVEILEGLEEGQVIIGP
jgi:RND family efflux transporter MFP subunit